MCLGQRRSGTSEARLQRTCCMPGWPTLRPYFVRLISPHCSLPLQEKNPEKQGAVQRLLGLTDEEAEGLRRVVEAVSALSWR